MEGMILGESSKMDRMKREDQEGHSQLGGGWEVVPGSQAEVWEG